jgi:hypothetical protein
MNTSGDNRAILQAILNTNDVLDLTLHGGGRGFESHRLHFR